MDCASTEPAYNVLVENRKRAADDKVSYTYGVTVIAGNTVCGQMISVFKGNM